jgi:hypothetical protein
MALGWNGPRSACRPSSRFVERLAKRHGWKPCPPVLADEQIRRNSGPQNSLRDGSRVRRGMDPSSRGGRSFVAVCQIALQTARLETMPFPFVLFLADLARSMGLREVGLGMTAGGGNAALKRCSPAAVVPTLPKTGEGWGSPVCGRSEKVRGVGQECPTHTVIEQAGLIRWFQHSNGARAGDPALLRPRLSPAIRTDSPKKLLARRGRRV